MKKIIKPSSNIVLAFTLFLSTLALQPLHAQVVFDDDVDDEVPGAPIDGLLGLGLAAGVWYGMRKLKAK